MRASVVTSFDRPLEIRDVPVPAPGPGQVLVRIEASGLCHTDIHAAHGVTQDKLQLATALGADDVVNAAGTDPVAAIEALGGVDVAVVLAADSRVLEQAHACLRRGGRLVLVSLPKENAMRLPIFETVLKGITVYGSIVGTRDDLAEVFRLHAAGRTKVSYEVRKLDEINTAIADVLASRVPARLVLQP